MVTWTDNDIYRLDAKMAAAGVARHARGFRIAVEILGPEFSIISGQSTQVKKITNDYRRLFPDADDAWPGKGVGYAASVDQVRKIVLPVPFGERHISPWQSMGFDGEHTFQTWCRFDKDIILKSVFAVADVTDISFGLDQLSSMPPRAQDRWRLTTSHIELTASGLIGGFHLDALTQSICLTVELSLKAALVCLGASDDELRSLSHNNDETARKLAARKPHRDDALIEQIASRLPPFIDSRYKPANLSRLEMVNLALDSQFVASSTVRRFTNQDWAVEIENEQGGLARSRLFGS